MKTRILYAIITLALCVQNGYGQKVESHSVKMRCELTDGKVMLRWAPTSAKAWRLLNKYGVKLEKQTIVREGRVLDTPDKVVLAECLKPEESDAFKKIAEEYSYGAIIAQAIFGEKFEVSASGEYDVATVIALGEELQQRYVFSLYAADLCFPAAKVAGWGWEDTDVRENERYLYTVIPLLPSSEKEPVRTGSLFVDMGRKSRFPKPMEFRAKFADGTALLSWNFRTLETVYNAYMPERSTDGINFTPISETPITQMESKSSPDNGQILYIDSIQNKVTYYYRLAGITPFGSRSVYSDTISGTGVEELRDPPFITKALPNATGGADIEWSFDVANEDLIQDFTLERSDDDRNNYQPLVSGIGKQERRITLPAIEPTNYFVITANTLTGKHLKSFASLVQLTDTIPPAVPEGLVAVADTTGKVRISWHPVPDSDVYGYRLYRGQTAGEELIPINDTAIRDSVFTDSLSTHMLNQSVFYAITSLDARYNQSELSPVIEVRKPETIPPTPPFIREVKITNGKNTLLWVSGQEPTLAGYEVYRKAGQSDSLVWLASVAGSATTTYEDVKVENNEMYAYFVKSRTVGGLLSEPSRAYSVKAIHKASDNQVKATLELLPLKDRIRIRWKASAKDVSSVQLYKKTSGGTFGLFREGLDAVGEWVDTHVSTGVLYEYMLVVRTNGATPVTVTKTVSL